MSKELYEEALADVKRLKEVAEDNAKHALVEAVTPRIRALVEKELLREINDEDDFDMSDEEEPAIMAVVDELIPDEEGKVTLDLDALDADPAGVPVESPMFGSSVDTGEEYELNLESVKALTPMINATKSALIKELEASLYRMGESIKAFSAAGRLIKESRGYSLQIGKMISRVENMYDYVQESITDSRNKSLYENKLETYFQELNKLQEQKMSKRSLRDLMNEGDVTLKLTGLPDEIDLDSVGVDLVTGEEEGGDDSDVGEGGDDLDLEVTDDEGGDDDEGGEGDDLDLDSLGDDEGQDSQMESRKLSDNTIVEIDEGMLRREISRMKKLREDAVPSTKGYGAKAVLDAFGGGSGKGDPWLDGDVTTETDEPDEDEEKLGEADEADGTLTMDGDEPNEKKADVTAESLKRRISFEKRLQERSKSRGFTLKTEARKAIARKDARSLNAIKKESAVLHSRYTESVKRSNKMLSMLFEASKKSTRLNGGASRPAESLAEGTLRTKLAETNLFNAKLVYTNKLLQSDALSKKQKASVIQQLDEATSLREVKLVYESLTRTLAGTSRSLVESADRKLIGSSSRATRPASTVLNEGFETDRWARLAGINKL